MTSQHQKQEKPKAKCPGRRSSELYGRGKTQEIVCRSCRKNSPRKDHDQGQTEKNLFGADGEKREALGFCHKKNGERSGARRVPDEEKFVELFEDFVKNGVFDEQTIDRSMRRILERLLEGMGIGADGTLSQNSDKELYGENPA
jgi:hypothetical protein